MAEASAPASAANLGPGYDCLAVAVELRCTVSARPAVDWEVRHLGPELPDGAGDLVLRAATAAVGPDRPLLLEVENRIPISRGLGSSAAATAATATAALAAVDSPPTAEQVFRLVTDVEGHADNAAACVYGGLALVSAGGHWVAMPWHHRWRLVVAVPAERLPTATARSAIPQQVPMPVVVRSLARVMTLAVGLAGGDPRLLAEAAGDELHEQPRAALSPSARLLMEAAWAAGAAHAAWSGAGPSVVAVTDAEHLQGVVAAMRASVGDGRILTPKIALDGLRGVARAGSHRPS